MAVKALMTDETGKQIVDAIRGKAGLEERVSDLEKNKVDKSSIAQTTGTAEDKVISQRAVTEELEKKFDKSNVVQSTGDAEDKVMSQAAATKEFGKLSEDISDETKNRQNAVAQETAARNAAITQERNRAVARENEIEELFTLPTQEAVSKWLDEHPEATTTVRDASLGVEKFTEDAKKYVVKDYVTPQMYGAVGDGVTDDTQAIQQAINSGKPIVMVGNYYVTDTILIDKSVYLVNDGSIIYGGNKDRPAIKITSRYNRIKLHDIIDADTYKTADYQGGYHGWVEVNYCGLMVQDASYSEIEFNRIINFTTGIYFSSVSVMGNTSNKITGLMITDCKYGVYVYTEQNGWLNLSSFNGIMINMSGRTSEFFTQGLNVPAYGVYQVANGSTYGMQYITFNDLCLEYAIKPLFTGFYVTHAKHNRFNKIVSEIPDEADFAVFDMAYPDRDVTTDNLYSNDNIFIDAYPMGGRVDIEYKNLGRAIGSVKKIAHHEKDIPKEIYHDVLGCKTLGIDKNNHSSVKGYSFTARNTNGNIDTIKAARSIYAKHINAIDTNEIIISPSYPISLKVPINYLDTLKVVIGSCDQTSQRGQVLLKLYDANGDIVEPTSDRDNDICGHYIYDFDLHVYKSLGSGENDAEFSVSNPLVKYVVLLVYGRLGYITISSYTNTNVVAKHWGNLAHANYLPDCYISDTKPTSSKDSETIYPGQKVYDVSSPDNLGNYWELKKDGDIYTWVYVA